ncbi:MAG: ceramidase domain-containing protein [Betaproteobacteria bacterium]|nr:ceramidase domain-containing protein [Betaproteobacteria bacterium]
MPPMPWSSQIDIYCERTDLTLWSEPLNALTNLAFLLAAALLWWAQSRALRRVDPQDRALAVLIGAIGVASFLFHTLATVWAAFADTLSILVFAAYFLFLFLTRAARLGGSLALVGACVFAALSYAFPKMLPAGPATGSAGYLPYVIALALMAAYLWRIGSGSARAFLGATLLFLVSLALRTADPLLCHGLPLGTHFAWHLLNAVVLYWLARELSIGLRATQRP